MTNQIYFDNLAARLGVESLPLGQDTAVSNRRVEEVLDAIRISKLKFVGYIEGPRRETNTVYLRVGDEVLAAKVPNPKTRYTALPRKPGY